MATRRRPNQPLPATPFTEVTASPVSTFVNPGQGGAPAQPVMTQLPAPPPDNEFQDLSNLADAFGSLSQSLANIGRAQATEREQAFRQQQFDKANRKEKEAEQRRLEAEQRRLEAEERRVKREAEIAERSEKAEKRAAAAELRSKQAELRQLIQDNINQALNFQATTSPGESVSNIGKQLKQLVETGVITVDSLPLRQTASYFTAREVAKAGDSTFESTFTDAFEKDDPALQTLEGFLDYYNTYTKSLKQDLSQYPDPGAAAAAIDTYRGAALQKYKAMWQKATSNKLIKRQEGSINDTVLTTIDEAWNAYQQAAQNDVSLNPWTLKFEVKENEAEVIAAHQEGVKREFGETFADQLEESVNVGMMSASAVRKKAGERLIDALLDESNFERKQFIRELLDYAKTGSSENRAPLLGKSGDARNYWEQHEKGYVASVERVERQQAQQAAQERADAWVSQVDNYVNGTLLNKVLEYMEDGNYNPETIADRLVKSQEALESTTYYLDGTGSDTQLVFSGQHGESDKKYKLSKLISDAENTAYLKRTTAESAAVRAEMLRELPEGQRSRYSWVAEFSDENDREFAIDILGKARAAVRMRGHKNGDRALQSFFEKVVAEQSQAATTSERNQNRRNLKLAIQVMAEFAEKDTNNVFTKRVTGANYSLFKTAYELNTTDDNVLAGFGSIGILAEKMASEDFLTPESLIASREVNDAPIKEVIDGLSSKLSLFTDQNSATNVLRNRLEMFVALTGLEGSSNTESKQLLERAANAFVNNMGEDAVSIGDMFLTDVDAPKQLLTGNDERLAVSEEEASRKTFFGGTPYPKQITLSDALTRASLFVENMFRPPSYPMELDDKAVDLYSQILKDVDVSRGIYFKPVAGSEGTRYILFAKTKLGNLYMPTIRGQAPKIEGVAQNEYTLEEVMTLAKAQPSRMAIADDKFEVEQQAETYAARVYANLRSLKVEVEGEDFGRGVTREGLKAKAYANSLEAFKLAGIEDGETLRRVKQYRKNYVNILEGFTKPDYSEEEMRRIGITLQQLENLASSINPNVYQVDEEGK